MPEYQMKRLNMSLNGRKVVQIKFRRGNYTRQSIQDRFRDFRRDLRARNWQGKLQVSLRYPEGWKAGLQTTPDEELFFYTYKLYDEDAPQDPASYPQFVVYMIDDAPR